MEAFISCEVAVVCRCHAASHASSSPANMLIGRPGGESQAEDNCSVTPVKSVQETGVSTVIV